MDDMADKKPPELELISFKLAPDLFKLLEKHAKTLTDPGTGREPSPSIAARQLLVEYLEKRFQK
jgi:hypothetical protein